MKRLGLVLLVLVVATGWVGAQWRDGGKEVPDNAWSKHKGEFGVMILLTSDPEGFMRAWEKPPSSDYKPVMQKASTVKRGENIVGFLIFTGCKADKAGHCDTTADLVLRRPDGSIYAEQKEVEVWRAKPAPPPGRLQVSVSNLGLKVEPDDPLGEYRLTALVRDKVAGISLDLESRFRVMPAE
jgi:hypothetical protein